MNMKDSKRLKVGALVREAWKTDSRHKRGIVLAKEYIEGCHEAKVLGGRKDRRYDIWVYWLRARPQSQCAVKLQCWELMLVQNAK